MLAEIGWHHFCVIPSPAKRSRGILGSAGSIKGLRQVVTTSVSSRAQRSGVAGSLVPEARLEKANSGKWGPLLCHPEPSEAESRDLGFRRLDKGPSASG